MMEQSRQYNFNCQFRCTNDNPTICKYQSFRLGHIVNTSHLFCNNTCPANVYEYGDEDIEFLKRCFNRRYDSKFLNKVITKYQQHTKLVVPSIWNNIKDSYGFLYELSWFNDIGLTGSVIVDDINYYKDIDVVICINNIDDYIVWLKNNRNLMPKTINNITIDYYMYINNYDNFFTSLWPNKKEAYVCSYFKDNIICPQDYNIIYKNFDLIKKYLT